MARTVIIQLQEPFPGHGGMVTEVEVREPSGRDYIELGEPYAYARADKNMIVHAENDSAIENYVRRCIFKPDALLAASQLALVDMMAVKDAVLGFITAAREARSAKPSNSLSSI